MDDNVFVIKKHITNFIIAVMAEFQYLIILVITVSPSLS